MSMIVHEAHKNKIFYTFNVQCYSAQKVRWKMALAEAECSGLPNKSESVALPRTDVSWIGIGTLQGFSPARTRAVKTVSCGAEKKEQWRQCTAGTHSYWIDFISFFNPPFKKKKDQLRLRCDVMHGAISLRVNRTDQWSCATRNKTASLYSSHSTAKVDLSDNGSVVTHRWQ